jgi:hypothetical protein
MGARKYQIYFDIPYCFLQNLVKNNKASVAMRFTTNDIFTRKNIVFFTCV